MMTRMMLGSALALSLVGCMPVVSMEVLQPAAVTLPDDVRRVAVLDRSAPADAGQVVMGVVEGLLTGEGIQVDRDAAAAAVDGVTHVLADSPRFDVVVPVVSAKYAQSGIFDGPLDAQRAARICRDTQTQAIVSLEAVDSDTSTDVYAERRTEEDEEGRERVVTVWEASRTTDLLTAWRLYYPAENLVLDDLRDNGVTQSWTAEGRTRDEALSGLHSVRMAAVDVGHQAGMLYGQRIAPHYAFITRNYFTAGDDRLKSAKGYVQMQAWDRAAAIWSEVERTALDPKIRARALYNLGLYEEVMGDPWAARELVLEAYGIDPRPIHRNRVSELDWRIQEVSAVDQQMEPVHREPLR